MNCRAEVGNISRCVSLRADLHQPSKHNETEAWIKNHHIRRVEREGISKSDQETDNIPRWHPTMKPYIGYWILRYVFTVCVTMLWELSRFECCHFIQYLSDETNLSHQTLFAWLFLLFEVRICGLSSTISKRILLGLAEQGTEAIMLSVCDS